MSIEADPGTFDAARLRAYMGVGVTRVSVGVQVRQGLGGAAFLLRNRTERIPTCRRCRAIPAPVWLPSQRGSTDRAGATRWQRATPAVWEQLATAFQGPACLCAAERDPWSERFPPASAGSAGLPGRAAGPLWPGPRRGRCPARCGGSTCRGRAQLEPRPDVRPAAGATHCPSTAPLRAPASVAIICPAGETHCRWHRHQIWEGQRSLPGAPWLMNEPALALQLTEEMWGQSLERALNAEPHHVSTYDLQVGLAAPHVPGACLCMRTGFFRTRAAAGVCGGLCLPTSCAGKHSGLSRRARQGAPWARLLPARGPGCRA